MNPLFEILDISMPLIPGIPTWPGSDKPKIWQTKRMEDGYSVNVSRLDCEVHVGTHVDAPRHFLKNGVTVDSFPLDVMIGSAFVVNIPDVPLVTPLELNRADIPESTERILIRTRNSDRWASGALDFFEDFTAISKEAAVWLVQRDIKLVGIDSLSIQPFHSHPDVHKTLMKHRIAILEGIDLRHVPNGTYELLCLPLKLIGVEAAPVRAVLRRPLAAPHSRIVGSGGVA